MNILITDRCKVWEIEDKNGYAEIKFSTSRKTKDNEYDNYQLSHNNGKNGYIPTYYNFIRVVGHAYNQLKDIEVGDAITNIRASLEREPFYSEEEGKIIYPKNYKLTIFEFEKYNFEQNNSGGIDRAPQVEESQVTTQEEVVTENKQASSECPF